MEQNTLQMYMDKYKITDTNSNDLRCRLLAEKGSRGKPCPFARNALKEITRIQEEKDSAIKQRVIDQEQKIASLNQDLDSDPILSINVGGCDTLMVRKSLLTSFKGSVLERHFSSEVVEKLPDGSIFLDRDPKIFKRVLSWLRYGK